MVESDAREPTSIPDDRGRFLPANRRQLSAPAIRTFLAVADLWCLTEEQRRKVVGCPSRSTFLRWRRKANDGATLLLSVDVLTRLSHLFSIHAALGTLFAGEQQAIEWLRAPHAAPPFGGQSPLDLITGGTLDGLVAARRFLDAAQEGLYMLPNTVDLGCAPYLDAEIQIR